MKENYTDFIEISNIKDMLEKTKALYSENVAYRIKIEKEKYKLITHKEVREMVNFLGTALIDMGLKNKRIAIIGENRYEWEIAYLSIVCGTGIVVPFDKALPEDELKNLIIRSKVEAILYTNKYDEVLKNITKENIGDLKYLISMDLEKSKNNIYSQNELIKKGEELIKSGNTKFIDATINNEEMSIMLFTSGTTSASKIVALSHKNIVSNLMEISKVLDVDSSDIFLSFLPLHHVFECTVGFLFALYSGAQTVFCDGARHIVENLNEYHVTVMASVPAIYERIFKIIRKQIEKQGNLDEVLQKEEQYKDRTMEEKKKVFVDIHNIIGGNIKLMISGAASLDPDIEEKYRRLGINLVQGYGLTETSPVVAVGSNECYKVGSIGKALPNLKVKLINCDKDGMGELVVKGDSIMLGYYENEDETNKVLKNGWFHTGDLAKIDEDGYIYICGRKKSVIVLKNGKNIFPEEIENLLNKIPGIEESFVFGKPISEDKTNIKIMARLVYNKEEFEQLYGVNEDEDIRYAIHEEIKKINRLMPKYKAVREFVISTSPLIKTTTGKIKREKNLENILNILQ